jgi:hypothetical protein
MHEWRNQTCNYKTDEKNDFKKISSLVKVRKTKGKEYKPERAD